MSKVILINRETDDFLDVISQCAVSDICVRVRLQGVTLFFFKQKIRAVSCPMKIELSSTLK